MGHTAWRVVYKRFWKATGATFPLKEVGLGQLLGTL